MAIESDERLLPVAPASCDCTAPGRARMADPARQSALDYLALVGYCGVPNTPACGDICACEVLQAEGDDLRDCQSSATPRAETTGWCYLAPYEGVGTVQAFDSCMGDGLRRLKFLGDARPQEELLVLGCYTTIAHPVPQVAEAAPIGASCVPEDERHVDFAGYSESEANVITGVPGCDSGICLVNHFRGRVTCPYGQTETDLETVPGCFLPGSEIAVTVPVQPQFPDRLAVDAVLCSCRCAGPGSGPFCDCPSDMECASIIEDVGVSDPGLDPDLGSYCIPRGTAWTGTASLDGTRCTASEQNCGDPRPY
jgi:hypothetical protein